MSLKHHRRSLEHCAWCPKLCRFTCPTAVAERRETVTPWGKMSLAGMVLEGRMELGEDAAEVFMHCLGCLHCRTHCRHGIDVPGALIEARARSLEAGVLPRALLSVTERMRDSGNPFGENLAELLEREADAKTRVPEAQAVLFAGCRLLRQKGATRRHSSALAGLGADYLATFEGKNICCGLPLWQAGEAEGFLEHARALAAELSRYRRVICPCPSCAYALRALYPACGVEVAPEVLHTSELLVELLAGKPAPEKVPGSFVFHDPCTLARHLEVIGPPREVLGQILAEPLAEMVWSGADAFCCGGGGLVPFTLPDVSASVAAVRAGQLGSAAGRVITCCPGCVDQLSAVVGGPEVIDLIDLVSQAFRLA